MGLSYLDNVYDERSNPENLFFSSEISGILLLNLTYNYLIKEQYQLNFSINYNHISNAGLKMPNKGMNFPTVSLGMDYILRPVILKPQEKSIGIRKKALLGYGRVFWSIRYPPAKSTANTITRRNKKIARVLELIIGGPPDDSILGNIRIKN